VNIYFKWNYEVIDLFDASLAEHILEFISVVPCVIPVVCFIIIDGQFSIV
jgi:hypothetical protein